MNTDLMYRKISKWAMGSGLKSQQIEGLSVILYDFIGKTENYKTFNINHAGDGHSIYKADSVNEAKEYLERRFDVEEWLVSYTSKGYPIYNGYRNGMNFIKLTEGRENLRNSDSLL